MLAADHIPNKRHNERIVLFLRRHWFSVLALIASFSLMTLIPIILIGYFWEVVQLWLADPFFGVMISVCISIYFLSVWIVTVTGFTDYYLDTWIVTNARAINIEQRGLFNRTASELDLSTVQDVTAKITGLLQTFFHYGDVEIQTAGEKSYFQFKNIPYPERVKEVVMELVQENKRALMHGSVPPETEPKTRE